MNSITKLTGLLAILSFFLFASTPASSQFRKDRFGKNRVQYKKFEWKFISTPNFDFYYYEGGYEIATKAAGFAEKDFNRITDMVSFSPYSKVKVFIYNSMNDLLQSNIGVKLQGFEVGGQTSFVRSEVEVAFLGNQFSFRQELAHSITDILIFEMMYGGNLKEILQSNYLLNLPEWFMAGAADYIAYGWDTSMDDYMRNMVNSKSLRKPENLDERDARMVGQSIWNYIAERYGSVNIGHILNYTRIVRNEQTSIQNTLGISYDQFLNEWREYYAKQAKLVIQDHKPLVSKNIIYKNKKDLVLNELSVSPGGRYIAYTENDHGRFKVIIKDNKPKGKEETVLKGGYKVINQTVSYDIPLIDWISSKKLGVISSKETKLLFWEIDVESKKKTKKTLDNFSHITDFDISSDGEQLILSASRRGQNDIFYFNRSTNRLTQITNDPYDDVNPSFLAGDKRIVFSSNRADSLTKKVATQAIGLESFNLFSYTLGDKNSFQTISKTLNADIQPIKLTDTEIIFASDRRGIFNLFKFSLIDSITTQITDFSLGIKAFDIYDNDLYFIATTQSSEKLYKYADFNFNESKFTGKTPRQQLIDLRTLQLLKQQRSSEKKVEEVAEEKVEVIPTPPKDEVDTDNYQFSTTDNATSRKNSFLERFKSKISEDDLNTHDKPLKISKPVSYEDLFTADNFITSISIDPLRGWGLLFEVDMTDILENHKINAGLFGVKNLKNSNFFAEYEYLKHRIDFRAKYERHNLELVTEVINHEYSMNVVKASASYPFNITSRISVEPFYAQTRFTNTSLGSLTTNDKVVEYGGFNAEFVYDNSVVTGVNMMEGTRAKIRFEQFYGLKDGNNDFGNIMIDARHYHRLHRSLILATRFSYGQFIGKAKKNYFLGGMDNWVFNKIDRNGEDDPLFIRNNGNQDMTDLLFSQFVTSLRGFNLNKWNGQNYMLFNAELRFPVLKYFYRKTITSNFFRNLQLIAFTDVGSSWTGLSPFNRENALNTEIKTDGSFVAEVSNFKNPFLVGYGFGARTMLLGYYTKFDVAWGVEDKERLPAKFYLTIGYDF